MLANPFYIGINRFNGKDYPGAQQPLLSKQLFEAVQVKKRGKRPPVFKKHNPVFKGVVTCESCQKFVVWQKQKGRYYGVCKRTAEGCKKNKMLREDVLEDIVTNLLNKLVSPSQEIIEWVASSIRTEQQNDTQNRDKLIKSIESQIERIDRMDDSLYDDKLSGDISQAKYATKHDQFGEERKALQKQLEEMSGSMQLELEHTLVLLELSQKAADLYTKKSPNQKRLIISKLFKRLTIKEGDLKVEYTKFTEVIADKVLLTRKLMEGRK